MIRKCTNSDLKTSDNERIEEKRWIFSAFSYSFYAMHKPRHK